MASIFPAVPQRNSSESDPLHGNDPFASSSQHRRASRAATPTEHQSQTLAAADWTSDEKEPRNSSSKGDKTQLLRLPGPGTHFVRQQSPAPAVQAEAEATSHSLHGNDPEWINGIPPWYYRGWETPPQDEKHFAAFNTALLDQDGKQCDGWKEEVQNLLILAGLFSAIVTAFIIESYQTLQPDPNDQIISLLSRIADQATVAVANASTYNAPVPISSAFSPTPSSIRVNIFWFISLVLSLTVALIGIITLQWLREHQRYDNSIGSQEAFAIFNSRKEALKRWYVPEIFASLPVLLQAAIVLFFVGLIDFLFSIRLQVAIAVSVVVGVPLLFLVVTTILPTLQLYSLHLPHFLRVNDHAPAPCPYKSPQALIFRQAAVASTHVFNLCAWVFGALCIPWVTIMRILSRGSKPFYGKSAPFSTNIPLYLDCVHQIQRAARGWTTLDMAWVKARTSYAVAVYYPCNFRHFEWNCYDDNPTSITTFYDCITGIKNINGDSNATDKQQKKSLCGAMQQVLWGLSEAWLDPLAGASGGQEVGTPLQGHFTALLNIISPERPESPLKSLTDTDTAYDFFLGIFLAETGLSESVSSSQLDRMFRGLFECSNILCIRPPLLLSARQSLSHYRHEIEQRNPSWMKDKSREWTRTLSEIIGYFERYRPQQPFTEKCTGSSAHPCGSNLHTDSIVELTQFILIFQVPDDIEKTLSQLRDRISSKPRPVLDVPFALITACAYINAVANVNLSNTHGFRELLNMVCDLCGFVNRTVEPRPDGTGQHWPKMEPAFDYIRSRVVDRREHSATEILLPPNVPDSVGSDENV